MLILPGLEAQQQLSAEADGNELTRAVLENEQLTDATSSFLSDSSAQQALQTLQCRTLYVHQGECASQSWDEDEELVVGSESATTCLIMIIWCCHARVVYVVHHDDSTAGSLSDALLDDTQAAMQQPVVFLVGSFMEPSGVSQSVLRAVLTGLHRLPHALSLRLACVWSRNTNAATGAPRAHSLYLRCSSGTPVAGLLPDRGPELPRRAAFAMCASIAGHPVDAAVPIAHHTFPGTVLLPGLPAVKVPPHHAYSWMQVARTCDDAALLRSWSTSPEHEPPSFVPDMRAMLAWVAHLFHPSSPDRWTPEHARRVVCYVRARSPLPPDWMRAEPPPSLLSLLATMSPAYTVRSPAAVTAGR